MDKITIVKTIEEANAITHNGRFHADDIMATVILMKYFGNLRVFRTTDVSKKLPYSSKRVVYDVGLGTYDHHQIGGNGVRFNNVPYASAGPIWRDFGNKVVQKCVNPSFIWKNIDRNLIQGIDAFDCGAMPDADYPVQMMSISRIIAGFNPSWDSEESVDEAFVKAVKFAEVILDNAINAAESKARAYEFVEKAISKCSDNVLILEKYMPWQEYLLSSFNPKAGKIEFVVYPSNRNEGYNWQCVPVSFRTSEFRKNVPSEWLGQTKENLREITGVETAIFCHAAGFVGGAETLEDTIKMVKIASDT